METMYWKVKRLSKTSSYRTYEEWKLNIITKIKKGVIGSYRTYEEWKRLYEV